jgi:hypothetical protein
MKCAASSFKAYKLYGYNGFLFQRKRVSFRVSFSLLEAAVKFFSLIFKIKK